MARNRAHDHALNQRRQRDFDKASTRAEIDRLEHRWAQEAAAAEAAQAWQTEALVDLRARLAAIERLLGPGGQKLLSTMSAAVGDALRMTREQDRVGLLAAIEERGYTTHQGTWDEAKFYAKGSMVTDRGATWIATSACEAGARPGRGPAWRLAAKAAEPKREPTLR